jgi:hypothetical protein
MQQQQRHRPLGRGQKNITPCSEVRACSRSICPRWPTSKTRQGAQRSRRYFPLLLLYPLTGCTWGREQHRSWRPARGSAWIGNRHRQPRRRHPWHWPGHPGVLHVRLRRKGEPWRRNPAGHHASQRVSHTKQRKQIKGDSCKSARLILCNNIPAGSTVPPIACAAASICHSHEGDGAAWMLHEDVKTEHKQMWPL